MTPPGPDESFLTPGEAAELFGVDRKTLTRWEQAGKIRAIRTVGGHRRYRLADLQQARDASTRRPRAPAPPPSTPPPRQDRAQSRKRALEILHAADVAGVVATGRLEPGEPEFARALVEGVAQNRDELDSIITDAAEHWSLERMPVVDRNVLRIGVFELMHTETPTGAVIDQAVTLAKLLSTEESGRFVNGLLGRIARQQRG